MVIYTNNLPFEYEIEKLTRLFFPFEKISFSNDKPDNSLDFFAQIFSENNSDGKAEISVFLKFYEKTALKNAVFSFNEDLDSNKEKGLERKIAVMLFECFEKVTSYRPKWGILTGIRPAKLYRNFSDLLGEEKADEFFDKEFCVEKTKLSLLKETAKSEDEIISKSKADSVSIYISIPFCPSRCSYCSFVSHSIDKALSLIPEYISLLCKEIEETAKIVKKLNLKVVSVYVGGGTPTTLSADEMTTVLNTVKENFSSDFVEFTVEAGRPDTITKDKLLSIKKAGVDRISINPQTMNDEVLKIIGRKHSADQTVEAFNLARNCGFNNINMDLIAGLPGDTLESFKDTVDRVINLNPDSVTVHSLSLKRSSFIGKENDLTYLKDGVVAAQMVDYAHSKLKAAEILPYYMYRQSKTIGNLENVGYARSGKEGIYNVYIMDETHTILACGASAVSKLKSPFDNKIERIFNYKYPYEYIQNFEEIIRRKNRIEEFYYEHFVKD